MLHSDLLPLCNIDDAATHSRQRARALPVPSPALSVDTLAATVKLLLPACQLNLAGSLERRRKSRSPLLDEIKNECVSFLSPRWQEVMSLTVLLRSPGSSGVSHLGADRLVSVLLLDRQRDGRDLWKLLPPAGPVLLNQHFGDP